MEILAVPDSTGRGLNQLNNLLLEDDTLGGSDQIPFTLAGLPCATFAGNSTYYDNNPPQWSYPFDQKEDTIQLMNPDGSDQKQITTFGSMSWAPYMHPSGEYFFFGSNKLGFENFELFIVDAAGAKEPVQVTYTPGFDSLPVPSPDSRSLHPRRH